MTENTPTPIKIQINSEKILRKLIDGDPELEIALKKAIVENVAKSYVGLVVASVDTKKVVAEIEEAVRNSVIEEFTEYEKSSQGYSRRVVRKEYADTIKNAVKMEVSDLMHECIPDIDSAMRKRIADLNSYVDNRIERFTTEIATKITETSVQREVNIKVDEKITALKEALG